MPIYLEHHRRDRAYSQRELAQRSGVAVSTINELEAGRRSPHPRTIRALALALDMKPDELTVPFALPSDDVSDFRVSLVRFANAIEETDLTPRDMARAMKIDGEYGLEDTLERIGLYLGGMLALARGEEEE